MTDMKLIINKNTYKSYLKKKKFFSIDLDFITKYKVTDGSLIEISDIKDKLICFIITDIDLPKLNIEVRNCSFYSIFVKNSILSEIKFISVEISEFEDSKFKTFRTYFDNSGINLIWCFGCTFYHGFLVRNESIVDRLFFNDCSIELSFTFVDSRASSIEFESSKIDSIVITKVDLQKNGSKTCVEKINVFRTDIKNELKVWEVEFRSIYIYKINLTRNENLLDFGNDIFINVSEDYTDAETIKISESTIATRVIISINNLKELVSYKSSFQSFRIIFSKISEFIFSENIIMEDIFWGSQNGRKTIEKFTYNSCVTKGSFYLGETVFVSQLYIKGTLFNKYPSFFINNSILKGCKVDFEYSNLKNFVFQRISFDNISFKTIDIVNSEFKDCHWDTIKNTFLDRFITFDEINTDQTIPDLVAIKNVYSKLKNYFQLKNEFIKSGKFYISEQEIKRLISFKNKSIFEYILLSFHKSISVFGESLSKPVILAIIFTISFSLIYLFTGFYSGERLIRYNFIFDQSNIRQTFNDVLLSLLLSTKNIIPFSVNSEFFLKIKDTLSISQCFELVQKILNLIFAASFTEAFIRYLKK